jgi:hypothetical protein
LSTTSSTDRASSSSAESTATSESELSATLPTIGLSIYEGPVYSPADSVYYYRVAASTSGNLPISVTFSRDDSHGAWGVNKTQINLLSGQTYTLTAVASNLAGTSSASITITAPASTSSGESGTGSSGSSPTNRPPAAMEISLPGTTLVTNIAYSASISASDPDGDTLSYNWTVTGGSITNPSTNPVQWRASATPGNYTISVNISDGQGGVITRTKIISVAYPTAGIDSSAGGAILSPVTAAMPAVVSEGGYVGETGFLNTGGCLFAGDSNTNNYCVGFISYNISGLSRATINSAALAFNIKSVYGSVEGFSSMCAGSMYWGENPINIGLLETPIISFIGGSMEPNFVINGDSLKTSLQNAINSGHSRFQIKIWFSGAASDGDNAWDGWEYDQTGIPLTINYTPGM